MRIRTSVWQATSAVLAVAVVVLAALLVVGTGDDGGGGGGQGKPVAAAKTSGTGVTRTPLGEASPANAPGQKLYLQQVTIAPHAKLAEHFHQGTQVARVISGTLTYNIVSGTAAVKLRPCENSCRGSYTAVSYSLRSPRLTVSFRESFQSSWKYIP